jgi:hypothetical protein
MLDRPGADDFPLILKDFFGSEAVAGGPLE